MNLPTSLTFGRLILAALFVASMSLPFSYAVTTALIIFIVASLTDWLDGELARQRNEITDLGKLLDPLADKILISAAFISLIDRHLAPMWMVVAVIAREFLITGLRLIAANRHLVLAAERVGKQKTVTQMLAVLTALLYLSANELGFQGSTWTILLSRLIAPFLWLALFITVISGLVYFYRNRFLFENSKLEKAVSPLVGTKSDPSFTSL